MESFAWRLYMPEGQYSKVYTVIERALKSWEVHIVVYASLHTTILRALSEKAVGHISELKYNK